MAVWLIGIVIGMVTAGTITEGAPVTTPPAKPVSIVVLLTAPELYGDESYNIQYIISKKLLNLYVECIVHNFLH